MPIRPPVSFRSKLCCSSWVSVGGSSERCAFIAHTGGTACGGQVLGIVYRVISMHLVKKAGYSQKTARTGAVTLIQRFGRSGAPGALNLNIHFHMLFLDGVYVDRLDGSARFR